ncbi:uncharacterized protein LOC105845498 [Hydra vulgaris]|uniref:uncharacterized protein LOC105845498 n=1 Tax=Hydra vulgaris TaxID=6087 RepID=UPI001F5E4088|nr:uncharacterized protein LOC105845498 [Hydra vulgaris]
MELNKKDCNSFDYLKVEKLPRDVLKTFSNDLPKHWMKLARFLNITDEEINRVLNEYDTTREKIYEVFSNWCRNNPHKKWLDIKSGLIYCEQNDVLFKCERMLTVRSIFGIQPSSENLFIREQELSKIHQCFTNLNGTKKSTLVLYGMSGVGKTQIARKYCEVYHAFYENFVWIDAAFGKLQSSMNNLYKLLGFFAQGSQGNSFDIKVIIEKVHNYYKNEKTLYIFDNVDDESVRNLEMYISKKPNSFTLVTSQWRTWSNNVNQMFIDVFSAEDAFAYVKNNIKETNENIRNLIKELSNHPFAITQGIKYIKIHKISIEKYINQYRSRPIEILDDHNFPTEEESKSAIKVINLVLLKLEKTKNIPFKILNCLSYCDGQNISKQFIIQISKHMTINDEYLVDEAIGLLMSYSLLDRLDDEKFLMHDLTQLSVRCFQNKNSSTNAYLVLMEDYFNFELNELKDHVDYRNNFVFHFLSLFRINRKSILKTFHHKTTLIKDLLECKGLFQEAIEILKAIQSFNVETYGENNKLTLETKYNIACCLLGMGKSREALETFYSIDEVATEGLGINHSSTLITKNNIAVCLCEMGKFNEALQIYSYIDKLQTEIFGINHSITIETKHSIAICLIKMGKLNEALEIFYSVDKIKTEIFGTEHRSTIATKKDIASCLDELGKFNEALEIFYFVDKIQTKTLGFKHPYTIATKHSIALCLEEMGKYNEALEIYCSVDKLQTEILGNNHPSTIGTKNNIAICLDKMGKYNEALKIFYSVDKLQTETLGINHSLTMGTKNNIANCLNKMRKYDEALEIYCYVDKTHTKILGMNHPSTMVTKTNMANCLQKIKKYNEALEIYYSVDKMQTEILGINHPSTMATRNNIANCLCEMKKYKKALEIYCFVDKIRTKIFGIKHPSTMGTKTEMANCLNKMGKHSKAFKVYCFVNKIKTEILGTNHPSAVITKINMANCLREMRKYNEALEIYYFVYRVQTEILGIKHPLSMVTKSNINCCLSYLEKRQTCSLAFWFLF